MQVKFHADEQYRFCDGVPVEAFTYTEYSIEPHDHGFYEVNIVLAGTGTHCIENGRFPVRRGDVFVIPPSVIHAYVETAGLEVYHILLKKSFLEENREESQRVPGFLQLVEIEPFLRGNSSGAYFLHLSHSQLQQLEADLSLIDQNSPFVNQTAMKLHTVWKLLYWFSALLNAQLQDIAQKSVHRYEMQILRVLEYMHTHYGEKVTIAQLCKDVYLSRSTFLRGFQVVCGVAPMEYLTEYRCKKAREFLREAACSKTEIAHRCGFYDLSHMERCLKKYGSVESAE